MLPDTGRNYLTKIFSDQWMQENGFWESKIKERTTVDSIFPLKTSTPSIVFVTSAEAVKNAFDLMHKYNISQIPVIDNDKSVGNLQEATLLKLVYDGVDFANQQVSAVMGKPLPTIDSKTDISEAYRILLSGANAVIVTENNKPKSILTRIDLIDFYTRSKK